MDFASEEFVSPPADVDQADSAVTATAVALFSDCPRRYFLDRYIGWQQPVLDVAVDGESIPDTGEFSATELGDLVHRILAGEYIAKIPADAATLVEVFSRNSLSNQAKSAPRCEREFPFALELEGTVLNGQIDLWFQNGDGITLVDYKTDRLEPAEIANAAEPYAVQLRLYAAVLQRITGELPKRAVLHFLRPDRLVEIDVTRRGVDAALSHIQALRHAQQSVNFPLREAPHCKRCPHYRGACPSKFGQEQLGLFESVG
jgi:CRISPR/Cas system-associated exonuclease Cas4 (RecB family)